jgi:hypothetical protein
VSDASRRSANAAACRARLTQGSRKPVHPGRGVDDRRRRRDRPGRWLLALCVSLSVVNPAGAQENVDREQAASALEQAQRDSIEIERRHSLAQRECEQVILVNPCLDRVRKERDQQMRAARERELAARDQLRRLDAEQRAKARQSRAAEKGADAPRDRGGAAGANQAPSVSPAAPRSPASVRPADPAQQAAAAQKKREEAEARRVQAEERTAEQERRAADRAEKAAQAPAEEEKFEARLREAAARADEKARLAEKNRQRREQRAKERSEGRN